MDYILADPTGNITGLITTKYSPNIRASMIREVFRKEPTCEQVGFVQIEDGKTVLLEMMGYEFCGNAALSAAAYLADSIGLRDGECADITVKSSGIGRPVSVIIRRLDSSESSDGKDFPHRYTGTLEMPVPTLSNYRGHPLVMMDGIAHLIVPVDSPLAASPETFIRDIAAELRLPALGILICDSASEGELSIRPLVYVPESDTLVWEHGCASGSIACAYNAYCSQSGDCTSFDIHQPGGTIRINIADDRLYLTGSVILPV